MAENRKRLLLLAKAKRKRDLELQAMEEVPPSSESMGPGELIEQGQKAAAERGMTFEPDAKFISDEELAVTPTQSLAEGAQQGATLGFADELQPIVEKGIAKASQLTGIGDQATAKRVLDTPTSEMVAQERQERDLAQKANPESFMAGEIGGGAVATAPVAPQSLAGMVGAGAGLGALEGAGRADENKLASAAFGGAVGGGLSFLTGGGIKKIGEVFKDLAQGLSVKSLRMAPSKISSMSNKELSKLGDKLLEEGITSRPGTLKVIKDRAKKITDAAGKKIRSVYTSLDDRFDGLDVEDVLGMVSDRIQSDPNIVTTSTMKQTQKEALDFLDRLPPGKVKLTDMWDIAQNIEKKARKFTSNADAVTDSKKEALITLASDFRSMIKDLATEVDPSLVDQLTDSNRLFNQLKPATDALEEAIKTAKYRGRGSIKDISTRIVDTVTGGTPVRTAAAGSLNTLQKFINGPDVGKFAPILNKARARGQAALNATHYTLMQTNEAYRKAFSKAQEEGENDGR